MSSPEHKAKIWSLIKDIKVGMLTTTRDDQLRARPMHIVQDEYDGTLWFYTELPSGKSTEILNDTPVCVTFSDPKNDVFVSLTGSARITRDQSLIEKYWNIFVGAWFTEGRESENVAMIEIKVKKGEHWDAEQSKIVQLYEVAKANLTDSEPDLGENQKFGT